MIALSSLKESLATETRAPKTMRWPNGAKVAIFFQMALEAWSDDTWPGVGPMANPLKGGVPDINAMSWADYGPRCGIYNLLKIFAAHDVRSSVVVNGIIADRYPEALKAVTGGGHEITGHCWGMDVLSIYLSEDEERANIARTTEALARVGGVRPTGWISPRGTAGLYTNQLCAEAGYVWHGDRLNDDLPTLIDYGDTSIVGILSSMEVNDAPMYVRYGNSPRALVETFEDTLAAYMARDEPSAFNVTFHAHIFGRPSGAWALDKILQMTRGTEGLWIGTKLEAATHFRSVVGRPL